MSRSISSKDLRDDPVRTAGILIVAVTTRRARWLAQQALSYGRDAAIARAAKTCDLPVISEGSLYSLYPN
jgi:hypothetical protein